MADNRKQIVNLHERIEESSDIKQSDNSTSELGSIIA
jgi:hypothetical protein